MACDEPDHKVRPRLRSTHTYVVLELSRPAYDEIRAKLTRAGYQHAFENDGPNIDMSGIAVAPED